MKVLGLKVFTMIVLIVTVFNFPAEAAEKKISREQPAEEIEIKGREILKGEELREIPQVEKVEAEEKPLLPEIPKPVKETGLNPAEKIKLAELEDKRAAGQITEMEYQIKRDALLREANIKF